MLSRIIVVTIFSLLASSSFCQTMDKAFIVVRLKETYSPGAIDSVRVFFINSTYLDNDEEINRYLKNFAPERITDLHYSRIKGCAMEPGYGTVYVGLVHQSTEDDNRLSLSQVTDRLAKAKEPVLFLNDRRIPGNDIPRIMSTLRVEEIYDVWRNFFDERDGVVKIWTKAYAKEKHW